MDFFKKIWNSFFDTQILDAFVPLLPTIDDLPERDPCPICYETITLEDRRGCPTCNNIFHRSCLDRIPRFDIWKCPTCRQNLDLKKLTRESTFEIETDQFNFLFSDEEENRRQKIRDERIRWKKTIEYELRLEKNILPDIYILTSFTVMDDLLEFIYKLNKNTEDLIKTQEMLKHTETQATILKEIEIDHMSGQFDIDKYLSRLGPMKLTRAQMTNAQSFIDRIKFNFGGDTLMKFNSITKDIEFLKEQIKLGNQIVDSMDANTWYNHLIDDD